VNPLERLLGLQALDTRIAQLEHRNEQLPEREQLQTLEREARDLADRIEDAEKHHSDLARLHRRYDDDLSSVLAKRGREQELLYSGRVTAIRELQGLEEEVAALGRRQRVVEDKLLDVMEQMESADADRDELRGTRESLAARIDATRASLDAASAEIGEECDSVRSDRAATAAEVATDLLERYENLRRRIGGVAVARLEGTSCLGCHLTLPLMEVDRLRRLPDVGEAAPGGSDKSSATCPSCGRILVI
jgi:hypothetical protein